MDEQMKSEPLAANLDGLTAALQAAAFLSSPTYLDVIQIEDEQERSQALAWFFGLRLGLARMCGCEIYGDMLGEDVLCSLVLQPPGCAASAWQMVRAGILRVPLALGIGTMRRLLKTIGFLDSNKARLGRNDLAACFELQMVVVIPAAQGLSHGSRILKHVLSERVDPLGAAVILDTQLEANVRFYERLGFKVIAKDRRDDDSYTSWVMLRESPSVARQGPK